MASEKNKLERLKTAFPLHWAVFVDDLDDLKQKLDDPDIELEKLDPRGRTPLLLAAALGHRACALELLKKGADANAQCKDRWTVSHEAVCAGDAELARQIIKHRDHQKAVTSGQTMKKLLEQLGASPDFYAEMSWEFSSWLPFVSRMCPSDTYKIFKRGTSVRIDTTLTGFDAATWQRGEQSFIFRIADDGFPQLVIVDHVSKTASIQTSADDERLSDFDPPDEAIESRMASPVSTTYVDIDRIGFERSKGGGLLSWLKSTDRTENVDGFDCKVFTASNVDLITKTRTEHLSEEEKARHKELEASTPLHSIMRMVRPSSEEAAGPSRTVASSSDEAMIGLMAHEYLDPDFDIGNMSIGRRPREVQRRCNSFKATLWLAENHPLSLEDQLLPIIDMMAASSAHFARLRNFVHLQLPAGFPAKIEIPLFHVVSAKITFSKVNEPGRHVNLVDEGAVEVTDSAFEIPEDYRVMDDRTPLWWDVDQPEEHRQPLQPRRYVSAQQQEDMLLQFAIQQSLLERNNGDVNVLLPASPPVYVEADEEDRDLARAIAASLRTAEEEGLIEAGTAPAFLPVRGEDELAAALRLSAADEERRQAEARALDEELQRVLELSMMEK